MAEIELAVTKRVLAYATGDRKGERQIAYSSPSPEIADRLGSASKTNRVTLRFGDLITLVVADRGAIWRSHNANFADDFDALFEFLARYPSQKVRFLCDVVDPS